MSIDPKDIKVGSRYLCVFPNDNILRDYLVVEISSKHLQDKTYVRLRCEDENSGISVNKWIVLNVLSGSIIEELEGESEKLSDTYFESLPMVRRKSKRSVQNKDNSIEVGSLIPKEEKYDYLEDFVKLQSEYLKMLIEEKKGTDNWKG